MLDWLAQTEYAQWVQVSAGWAIALTLHAFGTATVIGLIVIIGMRMFGMFPTIPYAALRKLVPFIWVAFLVQFVSGASLWLTKPAQYLADGMFEVKLVFIVSSIIVMWIFSSTLRREAAAWDAAGVASPRGIKFAAASALLWSGVTIGGRLTAYLGSLYPV